MSKIRQLADLLDSDGDVVLSALDNVVTAVSDKPNTSTGYIDLPSGTTAQRPGSPDTGVMRFNTTTGKLEMYDTCWLDLDTPPIISSVGYPGAATAASPTGGETITVLGSNFCTPTVIKFRNTATGVTTVFTGSVTLTSTTQLSFTSPVLPEADYDLLVEANGTTGAYSFGYTANALPGWTTAAGNIGSVTGGAVVSITVVASEPDAGVIAYSVTSGSLPTGLSLTTNVIAGTASTVVADTTSTFTMRAIDDEGQIADRTFNIVVKSEFLIDNSLRFNDDNSAYLSRTLGTSNRRTFTFSTWFKTSVTGSSVSILDTGNYGIGEGLFSIFLGGTGRLNVQDYNQSTNTYNLRWGMQDDTLYRDPSAWYHLIVSIDTTQASASDRCKVYINGSDVSSRFTQTNSPSQNSDLHINNGYVAYLGGKQDSTKDFDGYLAEVHFIDGQALAPTAFGRSQAIYGYWEPMPYSGTYGNNGFYLDFKGDTDGTMSATGGNTITTNGDYKVHTFTTNGTFTPASIVGGGYVEYLVIAGGGGGGGNASGSGGGGGGAGGYRIGELAVTATGYSVTVGDGGAAQSNGIASVFSSISSTGGGAGAQSSSAGIAGGSGGGGTRNSCTSGGAGVDGQGNAGATGCTNGGDGMGGGGGAGSVGLGGTSSVLGGPGGNGLSSSITGSSVYRAGGGGGGGYDSSAGGAATAGGGAGANGMASAGGNATANTGGGGGGGGDASGQSGTLGGSGGSGIVIIRYKFQ